MSRLNELYQETILAHNKQPRNFSKLTEYTHFARGKNPLCGDDYVVYLKINNSIIEDVSFIGDGCAISKSSGSLMTSLVKGLTVSEATEKKDTFVDMMLSEIPDDAKKILKSCKVLEGVKKYPIRVKCAMLVWRALEACFEQQAEVSTE